MEQFYINHIYYVCFYKSSLWHPPKSKSLTKETCGA